MAKISDILVQPAPLERIIDLRWRILRAGLLREAAYFDGDDEATTIHLAAVQEAAIVGCATILRRPWQDQPAWQLRGMAIEPQVQRCGVGQMLVRQIEQIVQTQAHGLQLWCNARTLAVPFYEKLGWSIQSAEFVIPQAGPHFKMAKLLQDLHGSVR